MNNNNNNFCDEIAMKLLRWIGESEDENKRLEYLKAFNSLAVQNCNNKKNKPIMVDASTQTEDSDFENEPEPLVKTTKKPILFEDEEEEETPEQENKGELVVPAQINNVIDSLRPLRDIRVEEIKPSNLPNNIAIRMVPKGHNDLENVKSLTNDSKKKNNINLRDLAVKLYRFRDNEDNSDYIRELVDSFFSNNNYSQITANKFLSSVIKPAIIQTHNPGSLYMNKFYDKNETRSRNKTADLKAAKELSNRPLVTYDFNNIRNQIMKLADDIENKDSWKAQACYLNMCVNTRIREILYSGTFQKSNTEGFIYITSGIKQKGKIKRFNVPLVGITYKKFKERLYLLRLALTDSFKADVINNNMSFNTWVKRQTSDINKYIQKFLPNISTHDFRKIGASYIMAVASNKNKNPIAEFKNTLRHANFNSMINYIVNLENYNDVIIDDYSFNVDIAKKFIEIKETKDGGYNEKSIKSASDCWKMLLNYDDTNKIYDGGNFRKYMTSSAMRKNVMNGRFVDMYNLMIARDIIIDEDNTNDNSEEETIGEVVEETTEEEPEVEVINID